MSIQHTVLGFEPMTIKHESLPKTARPWLPPKSRYFITFLDILTFICILGLLDI